MITEIELENVRLFEGSSWHFSLPPLSIFCGTNNSGKSTILKTLILLKQCQEIRESRLERQGRLELVGQQVDFGNYFSLVSHHETHRDLSIAITIEDNIPFSLYKFLCLINKNYADANLTDDQLVLYRLKTRFIFGLSPETLKNELENTLISSSPATLKKAIYEINVDEKNLLSWEVVISEVKEHNEPKKERLMDSTDGLIKLCFKSIESVNPLY